MNFTDAQIKIVRFCAIECEMQRSGERSVHWMVNAWAWATNRAMAPEPPGGHDIMHIGGLVEPEKNKRGFREVAVRVGWDIMPEWHLVPRMIDNLVEAHDRITPDEFFYEFERIHPFVDGNGRTGQILFNWLNGTLDAPVWAPNFFDDPRRFPRDGAP